VTGSKPLPCAAAGVASAQKITAIQDDVLIIESLP
jgi:hypothetical protein